MVSSSFNFPQFNSLIGLIYDRNQISSRDRIKGLPTGMTKRVLNPHLPCLLSLLTRRIKSLSQNCVIIWDNMAKWNEMTSKSTCPCLEFIKYNLLCLLKMSHLIPRRVSCSVPVLHSHPLRCPIFVSSCLLYVPTLLTHNNQVQCSFFFCKTILLWR